MKTIPMLRALALVLTSTALHAQVPQILNYQGRVAVGSPAVNFDGSGAFRFALVDGTGATSYWSNDGTSTAGSEPSTAVTLPVTKGLYSVLLGANMTPIPNSVFANADVRLRVWFDDGANGSQLLTPDQRIAAVGYAMVADTLSPNPTISGIVAATGFSGDGSGLTSLNAGNLTGTVTPAHLPAGTVISDPFSLSCLQPNGEGFESSSNAWRRAGIFEFRGIGTGGTPTKASAVLYTTNLNTWYRIRLYDATNNKIIAISSPLNTGTKVIPEVVDLGPLTNLPLNPAVFEIQLLSTDATGGIGINGMQAIGLCTFQMF